MIDQGIREGHKLTQNPNVERAERISDEFLITQSDHPHAFTVHSSVSHVCLLSTCRIQVSGIVDQIITYGKVTRPLLGISFAPEEAVEQLGVSGVLVLDAPPSGPAGKAVSPVRYRKQSLA